MHANILLCARTVRNVQYRDHEGRAVQLSQDISRLPQGRLQATEARSSNEQRYLQTSTDIYGPQIFFKILDIFQVSNPGISRDILKVKTYTCYRHAVFKAAYPWDMIPGIWMRAYPWPRGRVSRSSPSWNLGPCYITPSGVI